ncbi:EKC/KEOPS complex subunit Lage3 ITBA2 protein -like protein L antigen family member 3 [Channa argus]|uniref:L antigen family member 3 n=1 Tax=Channa argus TaxID=215402 RepID=A0A6G1QG84_CHAAH|nr:EKC/KEOPS complex subunit Lage3 ITBA2 protein -like protein L antigen family member 3 [Channa argus]
MATANMASTDGGANHETGKLEFNEKREFQRTVFSRRDGDWFLQNSLDVPFPSSREAAIALRSLSPDREPRKGGISKELTVSGSTLSLRWSADEARILRVSVNSFLDHLLLVVETMEMFGPPVSP